ncbi:MULTISPECIES: F0F1 ATP synthase subunit epsilon [unclassified Devosia]|uniref:F0F1 ATP synthase subunit epsilon n=1 Tax=unclassified Devosia TaxID=196773 RepID=UPI00145C7853|nr:MULTISPECIES: F0F1 ATP synthase subunit epsilon [unclassified Devosia]MBJ6988451.1 F0F1 ATP synthase subunit epsilon [Devosia sp. MC521]MBK1795543.1 F0F1 ATP synthase subunit epsilon [Devosia sp. WQ 349K1]QMW62495.1 F0F1 ATP synthase subunit epsilon [Devosia sp. MC521]
MAEGLKIEIVSPERLVLSETAVSVTAPGTEGYFTVMPDHAPFMTTLRSGFITVTPVNGKASIYFVRGGFADVSPSGLTILAEESVPFSEFDHEGLKTQIAAAQETLKNAKVEEMTFAQEIVTGLVNLAAEAAQLNGTHIH